MSEHRKDISLGGCENMGELLSAYIDGEVTKDENEKIKAHLSNCPHCRELYERLTDISSLASECVTDIPNDLHRRIMASVNAEMDTTKNKARILSGKKMSVASRIRRISLVCGAGIAAMLCLAVIGLPFMSGNMKNADMAEEAEDKANGISYSENAMGVDIDRSADIDLKPEKSADPADGASGGLLTYSEEEQFAAEIPELDSKLTSGTTEALPDLTATEAFDSLTGNVIVFPGFYRNILAPRGSLE